MKFNKLFYLLIPVSIAFASCGTSGGGEGAEKKKTPTIGETSEICKYKINTEKVTVKWTAFKFTNKTGVGGVFDKVELSENNEYNQPADALENMAFNIPISSINTNNPERDEKINIYFFGALDNTESISGKVISHEGTDREGDVLISITMNDKSAEIGMKYFVDGQTLTINGAIDVNDWEAIAGINALNSICKDLHTGDDGESKLWPDVDIEVTAVLDKNCK